jgi:hypothetical protein
VLEAPECDRPTDELLSVRRVSADDDVETETLGCLNECAVVLVVVAIETDETLIHDEELTALPHHIPTSRDAPGRRTYRLSDTARTRGVSPPTPSSSVADIVFGAS